MLKSFRTGVIVVVLLCFSVSNSVAVADPDDPDDPDKIVQSKETADDWLLTVSLDHVAITSVPNMAATAFTREAYISATATVKVQPLHPDQPPAPGTKVTQRSISLWLQEGCQAQLQVTTLTGNNSSQAGLSGSATSAGATSITPNVSETPNPSITETIQPGTIVGVNLLNKVYPDLAVNKAVKSPYPQLPTTPPWVGPGWTNDTLTVSLRDWDEKVDGCAGPVSLRFEAEATMSTPHSSDNVDGFSAIVQV